MIVSSRSGLVGRLKRSPLYGMWRAYRRFQQLGNFDAQWTSRYIHGFKVGNLKTDVNALCADAGAVPPGAPSCEFERGAHTYHNLAVGYRIEPINAKIRVGIDNINNKQPPILYQNNTLNGNTDERTFDTVGRYFWTSFTIDFK